jgi:hypothetical protein
MKSTRASCGQGQTLLHVCHVCGQAGQAGQAGRAGGWWWCGCVGGAITKAVVRFCSQPTDSLPPPIPPPPNHTTCGAPTSTIYTTHTLQAAHAARTTATAVLRTHPVRGMQCHVSPRPDDVGDCNHKRQRRAAVDPVHAVTQRKPLEEVGKPPAKKQSKGRAHRGTARARQAATPVDQPQRYSNAG